MEAPVAPKGNSQRRYEAAARPTQPLAPMPACPAAAGEEAPVPHWSQRLGWPDRGPCPRQARTLSRAPGGQLESLVLGQLRRERWH